MWYGPVLRIDLNPGSTESKDSTRGRAANSLVGAHFGFFHNSAQEGVASGGYREDGLTFSAKPSPVEKSKPGCCARSGGTSTDDVRENEGSRPAFVHITFLLL